MSVTSESEPKYGDLPADLADILRLLPDTLPGMRLHHGDLDRLLDGLARPAGRLARLLRELDLSVGRPVAERPLDGEWSRLEPRLKPVLRRTLEEHGVLLVRDLAGLSLADLGCLPKIDAGTVLNLHAFLGDLGLRWAETSRILAVDGAVNPHLEPMMVPLDQFLDEIGSLLAQYVRTDQPGMPVAARRTVIDTILDRIKRRLNSAAESRVKEILLTLKPVDDATLTPFFDRQGLSAPFRRRVRRKLARMYRGLDGAGDNHGEGQEEE
jgi:hypothetical protein